MNLSDILAHLHQRKKGLMAFNLQSVHQIQSLLSATEGLRQPAIIQFSEKYAKHIDAVYGLKFFVQQFKNPFTYYHLDHCTDVSFIQYCAESGFHSVMFDGSALPVEENARLSKSIKETITSRSCLLEVELGVVGGVEDGMGSDEKKYFSSNDLRYFHSNARYDLLALGIGNAHGVYKSLDGLRVDLFDQARTIVGEGVYFVLHGGTGIPEDLVKKSISSGVSKINISTNIKIATMAILKNYTAMSDVYDEIKLKNEVVEHLSPFFKRYIETYTI